MKLDQLRSLSRSFVIVIALVATACSSKSEPAANASGSADQSVRPIEVSTVPVVQREMQRTMEVVGSLEAEDEVTLSAQASGELSEISVDVGTPVRKGQVIARIDSRELNLKLDQAEAAVRQAEARLGIKPGEKLDPEKQPDVRQARSAMERARYDWIAAQNLVEKGDISRQQYDVAHRAFEQAEARYHSALENVRNLEALVEEKRASAGLAKKQLSDAIIVSPIAGHVKERKASRGEYLSPGHPIAIVVQVHPLRLKLEVPEAMAAAIKLGQVVSLTVDGLPGYQSNGRIKRISPSLDEKSRTLIAEAEVTNEKGVLKPGMFAKANIISNPTATALLVPDKAIVSLAGVSKVFVVEAERAVERTVKLGIRDGSLVEIVEGIQPGDRVITSNTEKLQNGASVSTS